MKKPVAFLAALAIATGAFAAEYDLSKEDIRVVLSTEGEGMDLAKDFFVTLSISYPPSAGISTNAVLAELLPDLQDRFQGFRIAEDFAEEPVVEPDGTVSVSSRWRLVPSPLAERYRVAPFSVAERFWTDPVVFPPPTPLEPAAGDMEINPVPDSPPWTVKRMLFWLGWLLAASAVAAVIFAVFRRVRQMVRIHKMSPIERALHELAVLLGKDLPSRGLYKDFYVELTMVVRRYISLRHGIRAPQLTTDEFLREAQDSPAFTPEASRRLKTFLESADLVKFAGLEATRDMADDATARAREYLEGDSAPKPADA